MTREDLAFALAALLGATFAIGWVGHWVWTRMARAASPRGDRADELAAELMIVEEDRDRRVAAAEAEAAAATAEAAATVDRLEKTLREREAELEATMDGLRAARAETQSGGDARG